jgi:catechol 2,3-dioxygenase-like lactoylglutathione lyase family enzyme
VFFDTHAGTHQIRRQASREVDLIKGLQAIEVITIFTEDLMATKAFYSGVFGLPLVFEDVVSAVFKFDNLLLNVLGVSEAPKLVEPAAVGTAGAAVRYMPTIKAANADDTCAELARHGVALLNGPINRPWGRRTAAFRDPAGNVWEIAQDLPAA